MVSNGDQTDTILKALAEGQTFPAALRTRTFEPDAPNFTPRISGILRADGRRPTYEVSILKSFHNDPRYTLRQFHEHDSAAPGLGHCITTYARDGGPLPSFDGEPFLVPILDDADQTAHFYWDILNPVTKVALVVKLVDIQAHTTQTVIVNLHATS